MKGQNIRLLAIAPYESMKILMLEAVKEFEDIDLNVFVGDLGQGLLLAKHNFYNDYDMIISRGGTASMLQSQLRRPIIEIEISPLDILRAMKIGETISHNYAIIGFPNITENAQIICQIMESKIDIFSINNTNEVENILLNISQKGSHAILCDMCAYTIAGKFGLNPVLIQSGKDCIRDALVRAREFYYTHQTLREENRFLRNLIWKHINHTIVFDENGELFFSTLENNNEPIVSFLKSECMRKGQEKDRHIIKQIDHIRYSIRLTREYFSQKEYAVYYFTENKVSLPDIRRGIRYLGKVEAEREYNSSIYGIIGLTEETCRKINLLNKSSKPVLIYGEDGTCKEQVVKYLYLQSNWSNKPLVIIDCYMLNDKAWSYFMDNHNSPLTQNDCTIFVKNIDVLSYIQGKQLLANLLEMNVCGRNRVIFSCVCDRLGVITATGKDFLETLCCMGMGLPRLCTEPDIFKLSVNKFMNYANVRFQKPLMRITPEVWSLLEEYDWPHNFTQFQRVLEEMITISEDGTISESDIKAILQRENTVATVNDKVEDANFCIDLNQPLEKINQDILLRVLVEENGNRTNAAKRLGIGRSTLWRFLKK